VSGHPKVLDAQAGVFPSGIGQPLLLRARRYRDLAREARLAAVQSNENVRDPFIRVATQWERLARDMLPGQKSGPSITIDAPKLSQSK
jgi:hypothetical protein